jgi:hypothetical protein
MADSTTNITSISSSQADKEGTANENFNAASPAMLFGRMASSTGLTWAYYGGKILVDGVITSIANGSLALTGSQTNYVEATRLGVVSSNTSGFTPGRIPLYQVVTGASTVSSYTDKRCLWMPQEGLLRIPAGSPQTHTLTAEQCLANTIEVYGAPSAEFEVVVPPVVKTWTIHANTTGNGVSIRNSGSPQSSVSVGVGKHAIVRSDGDRVYRVTADA